MPIVLGARLGPYKIVSVLGAGGMGEVYRASDTTLGRDVAIKVLPDAAAGDPERIARFDREARTLAALNHAHIAQVYGVEQSGDLRALVMELVEGRTLADRIAQGPIPLDEALPLARQIAEALEAAHERGIIHRDLKPANVKIRPDGTVKVLDFGLAKLAEATMPNAASGGAGHSMSPTVTSPALMTGAGTILGTAAYMSPEQARGKAVDKRADIWAFGCVLYEMLTGRRAFPGDEVTDTIAAIVRSEPDWQALPSDIPPNVCRVLERCLRKDVGRRLRDIGDARIELDAIDPQPAPILAKVEPPDPSRFRQRLAFAVAVLFSLTTAGLAGWIVWSNGRPAEAVKVQFDMPVPSGVTDIEQFQLSPDGRKLAFIANTNGQRAVWIRSIDSSIPQPLAGTDGAVGVFWSPGSDFLGFQVGAQFKKIAVGGGPPQALGTSPLGAFGYPGASWGGAGVILIGSPRTVGGAISRMDANGGPLTSAESNPSPAEFNMFPSFLPDGRHYFFVAQSGGTNVTTYVSTLDGQERRPLPGVASPVMYSSGHIVFRRETALMAQRFDIARLEVSGDAFPIADIGNPPPAGLIPDAEFSVSVDGVLSYRVTPTSAVAGAGNSQLAWFDRTGKQLSTVGPTGEYGNPILSPDGKYVAFQRATPPNIWVLDIARGLMSRLTSDASFDGFPLWSADGRSIVFMSTRGGGANLYQRPFGVVGEEAVLFKDDTVKVPGDLSRDGRFVVFDVGPPGSGGRDIWALLLTGDRKLIQITKTPFAEQAARISPDGRWIAYMSNESGERDMQLHVQSFPQPGVKRQVSTTGVIMGARWSRDGKELFYLAPGSNLMAVSFKSNGDSFDAGAPVALFKAPIVAGGGRREFDVSADGRFLMNVSEAKPLAARSTPITVVLNWAAGLKK